MFTQGQIIFAFIFIFFFSLIILFSYKKDSKGHKIHYKGTYKILFFFILGIFILFLIKSLTHNN